MLGHPLPGENALARAADRLEKKNGVRVGGRRPIVQNFKLGAAAHKFVRADIRRLGVKRRSGGDRVGIAICGVGIA